MNSSKILFALLILSMVSFACGDGSQDAPSTASPANATEMPPAPDQPATAPSAGKAQRDGNKYEQGDDYVGIFIENMQQRVTLTPDQVNQIRNLGESANMGQLTPDQAKLKMRDFRKKVTNTILTTEQKQQLENARKKKS